MSIDLQGWYIKTSANINSLSAKHHLEVIGANHSWNYRTVGHRDGNGNFVAGHVYHDGVGPQFGSADLTHTFEEQVELVILNYGSKCTEVVDHFRHQAEQLRLLATQLDKPIKSDWI